MRSLISAVATALLALGLSARPAAAETVTIFAAASTTDALQEIAASFRQETGIEVTPVLAASSTLAKQIAHGAPADLYLSADEAWMDYLAARGRIEAHSRVDLLSNRLALIAPAESSLKLEPAPGFPLSAALGSRPLALADPSHVPAGRYAKAALLALGVWESLEGRLAFAGDVRGALALVARGEALAGIVYLSDAAISERVRVVATFPADSHPPIRYPLALVAAAPSSGALAFYRYLLGPPAMAVFERHGFRASPAQG